MIAAIDPGNEQSAFTLYDGARPVAFGKIGNDVLLALLVDCHEHRMWMTDRGEYSIDHVAVEMIASYGMPVGREVFETCVWIGRFVQAWNGPTTAVYRREVKLHLCGQARAKDGNIRQALIDRFGGKDVAIGRKATPGPLYGISADVWSALAVAVTWSDQQQQHAAMPREGTAAHG